ncbi:DsbE family thiol:disulfide interchange protein [Granulosicoccus antarcticus]|uniref:Thiol:disulfide interchange protein DsbE n=1 Tax=Granulosicoccus antarcticus IMCC3135 TaxID=1192854 RepID=A0A2Z2NWY1_9GAMM|nr:DsbE family thiol:disulfide interchange protein [Granulosicoccus antarcticus]ASJ74945.1 Thiol:disulfide interchange protein DsbE [Granulosicoccus antarcticus IMCC3135]
MSLALKLLPLALFLALAGFLAKGLTLNPTELPSPLIDKEAPAFVVDRLPATDGQFDSRDMAGQVWVLNVWASWCGPCVQEHPFLTELAEQRPVPVVGLNYKDQPEDSLPWLARLGNPFSDVLDDRRGDVGLDFGVYGVPETFIMDKAGRVRYKHVGPVDGQALQETLLPVIDQLMAETNS